MNISFPYTSPSFLRVEYRWAQTYPIYPLSFRHLSYSWIYHCSSPHYSSYQVYSIFCFLSSSVILSFLVVFFCYWFILTGFNLYAFSLVLFLSLLIFASLFPSHAIFVLTISLSFITHISLYHASLFSAVRFFDEHYIDYHIQTCLYGSPSHNFGQ